MTSNHSGAAYDGNVLAGPLTEVFTAEITTAVARCRGCGTESAVATLAVFGPEPGLVARCPGCADVMLRLVRSPDSVWLDLGGMRSLRIPVEPPVEPAQRPEAGSTGARGGS